MTANPSQLGDMDPEAFRREAHRVADWIADYLATPERFPVLAGHAGTIGYDILTSLGGRYARAYTDADPIERITA